MDLLASVSEGSFCDRTKTDILANPAPLTHYATLSCHAFKFQHYPRLWASAFHDIADYCRKVR